MVLEEFASGSGRIGTHVERRRLDQGCTYLAAKTTPAFYTEHRSRVPYTPWYPTRYLFAGVKA